MTILLDYYSRLQKMIRGTFHRKSAGAEKAQSPHTILPHMHGKTEQISVDHKNQRKSACH